ncbi:MAG TPA: DnaJ family domain-containing protein [Burkholderiales bacterium]|nr:DnaJ family domain-containing protein [Burkholderiales bacterium]
MTILDAIAERRIREAQERGEFDALPGAGEPLALEEAPLVPEELRAAYRLLRNAGFLPPELESHREIRELEGLLAAVEEEGERRRLLSRARFLLSRGALGRLGGDPRVEQAYLEKVAERLGRRHRLLGSGATSESAAGAAPGESA